MGKFCKFYYFGGGFLSPDRRRDKIGRHSPWLRKVKRAAFDRHSNPTDASLTLIINAKESAVAQLIGNLMRFISSSWVLLVLLGILLGLSKLQMLPMELGFPGCAALLLAGHFVLRDVVHLYGPNSPKDDSGVADFSAARRGMLSAMIKGSALGAVAIFIGIAWARRARIDKQEADASQEAAQEKLKDSLGTKTDSLRDVSPEQLAESTRLDREVVSITMEFRSGTNKEYTAEYFFGELNESLILLTGIDGDRSEFDLVRKKFEEAYNGVVEPDGDDNSNRDDLSSTIRVREPFTQKGIAKEFILFMNKSFRDCKISKVEYKD